MVEFFRFWAECVHKGWELGEGMFSTVETLCSLVALGLFIFRKLKPEKWKHWEEVVMRSALLVFVVTFLGTTLFVAPFLVTNDAKEPAGDHECVLLDWDQRPRPSGYKCSLRSEAAGTEGDIQVSFQSLPRRFR